MPPSDLTQLADNDLALRSREDVNAFEVLVERYELKLLRYILRISYFSRTEAEEILQEAFLSAWKSINSYDPDLKFSTWIYRIAHNATISEYRKTKSRGREDQVDFDEELLSNLPSETDLTKELDAKLTGEQVQQILLLLPEKYRTILILKYLEEKNYDEISDILRIPPGTVATNLSRAKTAFRELSMRNHLFPEKS